jgi:hypothetical protein
MNAGSKRRRNDAVTIAWRTTKERYTKHRRESSESESYDSQALAMDYVEWASLVQMADNLHKRLRLLTGEADA